jgi:hypothetical protein
MIHKSKTFCCGPGIDPFKPLCPEHVMLEAKTGVLYPRCKACFKSHVQKVRKRNNNA